MSAMMNARRAAFFLLALSWALPGPVWSFFSSDARGTAAAGFLNLGVGARAAAMGEASSALSNDSSALYWNPAGLALLKGNSASFMHAAYLGETSLNYAALSHDLDEESAFGISVQHFSAGSMAQTDEAGREIGRFAPSDLALTLGYATTLEPFFPPEALKDFSVGVSVKYIRSKILRSAKSHAFDFGVLSPAYLGGRLKLAAVLTNLGGHLKFERDYEHLPLSVKAGSSFKMTDRWLVGADVSFPEEDSPYYGVGTEYAMSFSKRWQAMLRGGFCSRAARDVDGLSGVSFGVGLGFLGFVFDYGFTPFGSIGSAHRVSVSARF